MIGRNTKGGFVITSSPPRPEPVVSVSREALAEVDEEGDGDDDGEGDGDGDGDAAGVGVGGPCSVKLAHGLGCTLAHSLCAPGVSFGNGFTTFVKLPPPSAVTLPATREALSQ